MPVIKIIDSVRLYIYFFDHNPPHFHAMYAEYEELIIIDTLDTLSGNLPQKQRQKVIEWAKKYRNYLEQRWNEFNSK